MISTNACRLLFLKFKRGNYSERNRFKREYNAKSHRAKTASKYMNGIEIARNEI
jgi:hypothetical protein